MRLGGTREIGWETGNRDGKKDLKQRLNGRLETEIEWETGKRDWKGDGKLR